ncbi:MAG: glycoside hydrolase family 92 protein [Ferruginibacter sp.]|nr:glycoside hydrolase family 92 protein [Ferruginibacter sp.]
MKSYLFPVTFFFFVCAAHISFAQHANSTSNLPFNPGSLVNPFLGSEEGNVVPGACVPFGMVKLSPDTRRPQANNGYSATRPIIGFSHTHTSGTGGGARYGNILVIPSIGEINKPGIFSSVRSDESAKPGYYQLTQQYASGTIKVKLTASKKVGFHQYQFFDSLERNSFKANILMDVSHSLNRSVKNDIKLANSTSKCVGAMAQIEGNDAFSGKASFKGGWGAEAPYIIYFYGVFDHSFEKSGTWGSDSLMRNGAKINGDSIGLYASFNLLNGDKIKLKLAISYISIDKAKQNLIEIPGWDFEAAQIAAFTEWNNYLKVIEVKGGTPAQQKIFYSCLRNTLLMPTDITGENPGWSSGKPNYWDHYCIWDVFRSVMPLFTLFYPKKQVDILVSLLDTYEHLGWLPDGWVAGHYAKQQGGTNADVVFADAFAKGLKGFNKKKAFAAILKNATVESDDPAMKGRYLTDYLRYGYNITRENIKGASSRTMEYCYNDYCIAQVAKQMGEMEIHNKLIKRASNVFTLFNDSIGYFWAKDSTGRWQPDFTLNGTKGVAIWNDPYFYEGGSEMYSYYVPHDMQGLISRHGGAQKFRERLDEFFDQKRFHLSNEPLFLVPYSYNYAGMQNKTALRVRTILEKSYNSFNNGLPGQDDSGALSSWFVFSAMGIFPVAGQDIYLIGSPVFNETIFNLPNGKKFKIIANNASGVNIYIQSAKLNGKYFDRSWIKHQEIINGGVIEFDMGNMPANWGNSQLPL